MTTSVQHVSSSGRKQLKHLVRHTHCILLSRPEFFNLIWEPNFETHLAPDLNSWKDCFLMPAVSLRPARLCACSSQLTTLAFFSSPEIQHSTFQDGNIMEHHLLEVRWFLASFKCAWCKQHKCKHMMKHVNCMDAANRWHLQAGLHAVAGAVNRFQVTVGHSTQDL